ncbi:MAG: hypothetical protein J6S50_00350 [Oscillospiraceae bacterium]|nr:hypothetical protein [Oscillospiraceae bacterium]
MSAFVTTAELEAYTGVSYTGADIVRVETLLPLVSDLIRSEGKRVGVNVDAKMESDEAYASVVKMVTCDVMVRVMRQSMTGDPLTQESQSGLGYSWSGTYTIPGGGAAMSLMNNEKKLLGFRRQRYGVMELWEGCTGSQ